MQIHVTPYEAQWLKNHLIVQKEILGELAEDPDGHPEDNASFKAGAEIAANIIKHIEQEEVR